MDGGGSLQAARAAVSPSVSRGAETSSRQGRQGGNTDADEPH